MIRNIETNLKWNGDEAKIKMDQIIEPSLLQAGIKLEELAVKLCPRATSRLAGSITVQTETEQYTNEFFQNAESDDIINKPNENKVALVGTNCEYAIHVEYGTRKMKAQPYMRPAYDLGRGEVLQVFNIAGQNYFSKYFFKE